MLVAGNWKMHKTRAEGEAFCRSLREAVAPVEGVEIAVCPPFTALGPAVEALAGSEVAVLAQNVHWADEGAFTGEISAGMLLDLGVDGALTGHSERRQLFGERDEGVGRRTATALEAGLRVIACVGETDEEREAGQTEAVLARQAEAIRAAAGTHERLTLAYEPVWAIGTGKTATPEIAQEAHEFLRGILDVPILYGGSVKPDNAAELCGQPDVDGALVGGASLEVESFAAICEAAARAS
jgi:triosephosphate isomerase (TIM)